MGLNYILRVLCTGPGAYLCAEEVDEVPCGCHPDCLLLCRSRCCSRPCTGESSTILPPGNAKLDIGMDFSQTGSYNAVDEYLDMDDALQNYILSLGDRPLSGGGGLANDSNGQLNAPPSASEPVAAGVQGLGGPVHGMALPLSVTPQRGVQPSPIYGQEDLRGVPAEGNGTTSPTGMPGVGGPFVFTSAGDGAYGGRSTSDSGSGGTGQTAVRQRKRRDVAEPDVEEGTAEKKQQVMQEKNRLAQRRFRERQKVRVGMEWCLCCCSLSRSG